MIPLLSFMFNYFFNFDMTIDPFVTYFPPWTYLTKPQEKESHNKGMEVYTINTYKYKCPPHEPQLKNNLNLSTQ